MTTVAEAVQPLFFLYVPLAACATSGMIICAITLAPRFIPAAEVALVVLSQNIFGPLYVFIVVGEAPSTWTLAGGGLLLIALAATECILLTNTMAKRAAATAVPPLHCAAPAVPPNTT